MQERSVKGQIEPVQDIAISSLLEIDLVQQQGLNIWEDKRIISRPNTKQRTFSCHKPHQKSSHITPTHKNIEPLQAVSDIKPKYHLAMLKEFSQEQALSNPQEDQTQNALMTRSAQLIQRQYWSSRVNWMPEEQRKGHRSQPKLNKKFSFGYEVNGRTGRNSGRNSRDQRNRQNQYKTNLIYSLLTSRDATIKETNSKGRYGAVPQSTSPSKNALKKVSIYSNNTEKKGKQLSGHMQQYMRQTLKKLYLKNRRNNNTGVFSPVKPSEHSSMIRELLINIQNIRDYENSSMTQSGSATPDLSKQNGIDFSKEIIHAVKMPQRKLYHLSQHQYSKHVFDINSEVGRAKKARPIHQGVARPPTPINN